MKSIVVYATKSGNTKKVAAALASELGCPLTEVSDESDVPALDLDGYDLVLLGTGIYRGQPHPALLSFIDTINVGRGKSFALFMTCFGWGKGVADKNVVDTLSSALGGKGQRLLDNHFSCFGGGMGFVKRGHPDASELDEARKWARRIVQSTPF